MSETNTVEVAICSSCMAKHVASVSTGTPGPARFDSFVAEVKTQLEEKRPDLVFKIKTQSCFRFCPDDKITVSVARKITMSREATVDSVVQEILSLKNS
ncbi:MAG: hypothetical protein V4654_02470 [Bdellovibrionota bacterium]